MADKKISALTAATTPLAGTEVLPIVQSGATVKVANNDLRPKQIQSNATSGVLQVVGPAAASTRVMTTPDANFTAARTDAAQSFTGDQTLSSGNLIQGTAAKGFNFTANTPAAGMSSQLLNWYEEGIYTATMTPETSGTITLNASFNELSYTRVGRLVTVTGLLLVASVSSPIGTYVNVSMPTTSASLTDEAARFTSVCYGKTTMLPMIGFEGVSAVRVILNASTIAGGNEFYFTFTYVTA